MGRRGQGEDERWYLHRHHRRTVPRKVQDGIRARSRKGEIGKTWWGRRWLETLESYDWSSRLERGRKYARMGQVVSFKLSSGRVDALVQGSRPKPYSVVIDVKPISKAKWKSIASSMAARAVFASKLLAGEMPADVEAVFSRSSVTLFPGKREIRTDCSCPDPANPCKHVAAVYYILAEEFDREPFMMFLLRGETRDDLMASLRDGRRVAAAGEGAGAPRGSAKAADVPAPAPPLEDSVAVFWIEQKPLGGIVVAPRRPQVDAAVIKRLGEPPFWREPEDFTEVMEQVYGAVTSKAMKLAFG